MGLERSDDAGVFRLRDDLAIIQTVDFFTPIVDDPYSFGQVAAANAMSDIYAMGGSPLTALNIICFPVATMDISVLQEVMRGGLEKIKEAGALLVGGHSVEDDEFKYGLSVTGIVHPDRIITNRGARPGDRLVLTKPLGTGIINTGIKGNLVKDELVQEVTKIMSSLNRIASEVFDAFDISACTDVTGFGLIGHACEMIDGEEVGLRIYPAMIPLIRETLSLARMGIVPGGTLRNQDFRRQQLVGAERIEPAFMDIMFDPQTSGGLLIAVSKEDAEGLVSSLTERGERDIAIIGEFIKEHKGRVVIEALK